MSGRYTYKDENNKVIVVNYMYVNSYKYNAKNTLSSYGFKTNVLDCFFNGFKPYLNYQVAKSLTPTKADSNSLKNMFADKGTLLQNTQKLKVDSQKAWKKRKSPYKPGETPRTVTLPIDKSIKTNK